MIQVLRLYQSPRGIWHYEFERDGKLYWASLHTRSERIAQASYKRIKAKLEKTIEDKDDYRN